MIINKLGTLILGLLLTSSISANQRNLEQELGYLHDTMQPLIPLVIDDATRLVAADINETTFSRTFHIAVPQEAIEGDVFALTMMPALVSYVCNTDNQKPLITLGGKHRFVYLALTKEVITDISIALEDCVN